MQKAATDTLNANSVIKKSSAKNVIEGMLNSIGVGINGTQPWDIQVHNEKLYDRVLTQGALGLGESYMDQWWDCEELDALFAKLLRARLDENVTVPLRYKIKIILSKIINYQSKEKAKKVAYTHYNLGNTLFQAMLDTRMMYSCGYWKEVHTLEAAQLAKLDLICRKLQLQPGQRLLDIGCGWGGLARYAAENYGVKVVGVTISQEQAAYGQSYCQGLPIDIRLQDYRDIHEHFDRIVSVGMFEHVGTSNYKTFMQKVYESLTDDGLFLLHTIGSNETYAMANEWTTKYIFPNGVLPSIASIGKSVEKLFVMEDWHNFSAYYDKTLLAWHENFIAHWRDLQTKYDERFYRMWKFYLLTSAGSFRARLNQLWQIVFSKHGVVGGYYSHR